MDHGRLRQLITTLKDAIVVREEMKTKPLRERNLLDPGFYMGEFINECGTPACVLGHYAMRKDLQNSFFAAYPGSGFPDVGSGTRGIYFRSADGTSLNLINHDGDDVQEYFDLNETECNRMFGSAGCGDAKTEEEAIAYIKKCIETGNVPREGEGR